MLEKGITLEGYRIDGVIGQGGMGVVYQATQLSLERTVALKVLPDSLSGDPSFRERFRREGRIQAAIDHPHIVTVYEAGESQYGLFLAMRLVRGPNLKNMVVARELSADRALRLLAQVAGALESAHEAGLVHRDIKPQNILVGPRDHAYLADFGLTKAIGATGLTRTGQFVGTLDYISPEQIQGRQPTTCSDVYALAAVLYECLTGVVPFPKDSDAAVLFAHITDPPPSVTEQRPELPTALDGVIARAMAKDPDARQGSALELIEEAQRALDGMQPVLAPPGPIQSPEEAGIRRPPAKSTRLSPPITEPAATEAAAATEPVTETDEEARDPSSQPEMPLVAPAAGADSLVADTQAESTFVEGPPAQPAPTDEIAAAPGETRAAAPATAASSTPPTAVSAVPATAASPVRDAAPGLSVTAEAPPLPVGERRWRRKLPVALVAALVLVGLGVGGFFAGNPRTEAAPPPSKSARPPAPSVTALGNLALTHPRDWGVVPELRIPGLDFTNPITLAPRADAAGLVAGQVDARGPSLLPATFHKRLPSEPSRGDPVRLGELAAYRYDNLEVRGFEPALTLYVVPNTGGVATVACFGERIAECENIATTLRLQGEDPYPLGPSRKYASALSAAIKKLNNQRATGLTELVEGSTPTDQANAAGLLAGYYQTAARAVAALRPSPQARPSNDAIAGALRRARTAYLALRRAARSTSEGRYDDARDKIRDAEGAVGQGLRSLKPLGYSLR